MKKIFATLLALLLITIGAQGVMKEKNLEQTLSVLRAELTAHHNDLTNKASARKEQTRNIIKELQETINHSNQNALMLYSQQQNCVFDLTYACHEATEQYLQFQQQQLPFKSFVTNIDIEIAKYDSLVVSLKNIRSSQLSQQARNDWTVCLTLATNVRNTLIENRRQVSDYISLYEMTEQRLKNLNDYATLRYNEIQLGIFKNGGENYFTTLRHFGPI